MSLIIVNIIKIILATIDDYLLLADRIPILRLRDALR